MKSNHIARHHEQAKIYHHHYRPSLNILRLFKSVLAVFISGTSHAGGSHPRRK
jgi:hypothetical protein